MKKSGTVILIMLLAFTFSANGQLSVGYQTDGNTLSLSTNPVKKLWGEFRVNTKEYNQAGWSYNDKGIIQLYLMFPLFSSKNVTLYAGGGAGVNALSDGSDKWLSVNIPAGLRMNPFNSLPDFYFVGEYTPMIILAEDTPVIHCISIGFRYLLNKN